MTNLSGANLNNGVAVGPQGEGRDSPSTFPKYPAYKDSGVEWLGEVPEHWAVHPLKRAIERIESGTSVNAADFPAEPGSLGVLKTSCVYTGKFDWAENKTVDDEDLSRVSCPLRKDTLIVSRMNTPDLVGATGLVTEAPNGIFLPDRLWQVYFLVNHSPEFLFYFSKSREYREQVKMACSGTSASMQNLGQDDFRGLLFAEPPKPEQTQIARFLDHETARIDALIEEQQRLIELLKEKRQAVISHAVTKGLDPTVPMKDSGVEWLGEVPAHWDVIRSKFVFRLASGYAFKSEFFQKDGDGEKVLITPGSFDEVGRLYFSEKSTVQYSGEWQSQFELKVGDLVMVLTDLSYKKLILGRAAFVERDDALLNQRIAKVIITPKVKASYLWLGINSEVMREQVKLTASGATVFHTSPEKVGDCWMAVPPCEEQLQIAVFAEKFHLELDSLIEQVRDTVGLLSERRSALISAAVTGKIDVRGWQPPVSTQAPELEVAEAS